MQIKSTIFIRTISLIVSFLLFFSITGIAGAGDPEKAVTVVVASYLLMGEKKTVPPTPVGSLPFTMSTYSQSSFAFVSGGIPFPMGVLASILNLRVETENGQIVNAQFTPLAYWPDNSLKSVLVSFVQLESVNNYILKLAPDSENPFEGTTIEVVDDGETIVVNTNKAQFVINKDTFGIFQSASIDLNNNGTFESSELILSNGSLSIADVFTDKVFSSNMFSGVDFSWEENGSVHAVLKATGKLRNDTGQELTDFIVRITFYYDSSITDVEYTLIDTRPELNVEEVRTTFALSLEDVKLTFDHAVDSAQFAFGGNQENVAHSGSVTEEHYLLQKGKHHFVVEENQGGSIYPETSFSFNYSGVGSGDKAAGWMSVANSGKGLSVLYKGFWQQFPNEMSVTPDTITLGFHPKRSIVGEADTYYPPYNNGIGEVYNQANTLYFAREGGAKTFNFRLQLHDGSPETVLLHNDNVEYQSFKPTLLAEKKQYIASKVFGELAVSDENSPYYDDFLLNNILLYSRAEANFQDIFGWKEFGDHMRGDTDGPNYYNDTHVGSNNYFKQFLRTDNTLWWELAEAGTRHFMDIDISHSERFGYHSAFNNDGSGYTNITVPPGEMHANAHATRDHHSRTGHISHAHVSGLTDFYLLSGNKRALEVIKELGGFWKVFTAATFVTPRPAEYLNNPVNRLYAEAERDYAWPLYVMNEVVRVTNDSEYHQETASQLVKYLIEWWQTPGYQIRNGQQGIYHDYTTGTGWWRMDSMDNGNGTGTNPWMGGALLSSIIQFYENNKLYDSDVDNDVVEEMLFQTMNYIVKFGWQAADENSSNDIIMTGGYFSYTELDPDNQGHGPNHILFPVAYLSRLLEQKIASQQMDHANWYDTYPSWKVIAGKHYDAYHSPDYFSGSIPTGFYGYEMVYPIDFFSIVKGTLNQE